MFAMLTVNVTFVLNFVFRCWSIRQGVNCRPDAGYVSCYCYVFNRDVLLNSDWFHSYQVCYQFFCLRLFPSLFQALSLGFSFLFLVFRFQFFISPTAICFWNSRF